MSLRHPPNLVKDNQEVIMNNNPTQLIQFERDPLSPINNQEITLDNNLIIVYHQDFLRLIKKIKNKALLLEC